MTPDGFDWLRPDYTPVWAERMARLKALRDDPSKLPGVMEFYKTHPAQFINDWGVTFNPKNVGTQVPPTMPFLLFPKQVQFIEWLHAKWKGRKDGVCEKSRDMGVTWLCVAFASWMWIFWPGGVIGFGSRKEDLVDKSDNPDSIFWKVRAFIRMLPVEFQPPGYKEGKHAAHLRIVNPSNEAAIIGEAGDNIGRGGRSSIYIKDESAHWEHPESCDAALSQNTNVQIDISTPNGEGNPFWHKVHGGKFDVFVFDWKDDPRKDRDWYAQQVARMTAVALAAEVNRDYSASIDNSHISGDVVTAAMARGPADVPANGPLMVGIDVARFGADKTVITFRRGRVLIKQIEWGKTAIDATAGRCKHEIDQFRERPGQIAVDVIGVGSGVADLLRSWYKRHVNGKVEDIVQDVNSSVRLGNGTHYNLRSWMWDQMKDWLPTASIPNDQSLRVDLTGIRYEYKGGELLMEDKEDMKARGLKSPDKGDSLAMTFAFPPKPTTKPIDLRMVVDYAPMNEMGL